MNNRRQKQTTLSNKHYAETPKIQGQEIKIIQVLCRMTINNRTQKLNKNYADTTTKQKIILTQKSN